MPNTVFGLKQRTGDIVLLGQDGGISVGGVLPFPRSVVDRQMSVNVAGLDIDQISMKPAEIGN